MQPLSDEAPLALFDSVFTETAVASGGLTLAVRT